MFFELAINNNCLYTLFVQSLIFSFIQCVFENFDGLSQKRQKVRIYAFFFDFLKPS